MTWSWFGSDREGADGGAPDAGRSDDEWWLTGQVAEVRTHGEARTPRDMTAPSRTPGARAGAGPAAEPDPPTADTMPAAYGPDSRPAPVVDVEPLARPPAEVRPPPPGHAMPGAPRRRRRVLLPGLALVLTVAALAGGYAFLPGAGGSGTACAEPVPVAVAVPNGLTEVATAAAAGFRRHQPGTDGACYAVRVVPVSSTDSGAAPTRTSEVAAVIAGPTTMPSLASDGDAASALGTPVTLARTLAVVALPAPMADALGWSGRPPTRAQLSSVLLSPTAWRTAGSPDYGPFTIAMAEPTASPASAEGLVVVASEAAGKSIQKLEPADLAGERVQGTLLSFSRQVTRRAADEAALVKSLVAADRAGTLLQTTSAVVTDERTVLTYNLSSPRTPLVAVYPEDGVVGIDLTFTPVRGARDTSTRLGANAFRDYLTGDAGQAVLTRHGYRGVHSGTSPELTVAHGLTPDAQPLAVPASHPDVVAGITAGWQRLQNPGRFLVAMDVSGSMSQTVPGTGRTKLQFAQDAAVRGMQLVPPAAEIGLWEFSTALDGSKDYRELVPLGEVGDQLDGQLRLDSLIGAVRGLTPRADTGLYDSALAAFRAVRQTYSPGEPNIVVLLTDGRNDDPGSLTLADLVATLEAEQDDERPVRFLTIAYGADADTKALARIAAATNGSAYTAPNPADIDSVFFRALTSP
jgi:Ca-activated chloride channel family protein